MSALVENALFQWDEGERRVARNPDLRGEVGVVFDELRRRLGSKFTLDELARFHARGLDWATAIVSARARDDATSIANAAFRRYAREAADYAGGRRVD